MGKTNRKNQRGPKNVDLNPNPGASDEEQGTDNIGNVAEEPKAETKPQVQQTEQKRRDPIFDEFYTDLRYGHQVTTLTLLFYGPDAAAQKRVEMQHELVAHLKSQGQRVDRSFYRDLRLAEIATELKLDQRAVTMESNGFVVENQEKFIQRLQLNAARNHELASERSAAIFEELSRLRDQHRDDERSKAVYQRRKELEEREKGSGGALSYADPGQETKLGDIAPEAPQATGTEG